MRIAPAFRVEHASQHPHGFEKELEHSLRMLEQPFQIRRNAAVVKFLPFLFEEFGESLAVPIVDGGQRTIRRARE